MQREVNVLALIKGNERFIYVYDDASQQPLIETFRDQAADPRLSFSWFDAAVLTEKAREAFFVHLTSDSRISFGVGIASPAEIDRLNILRATYRAMERAVAALPHCPNHLLIDGLPVPILGSCQTAIIDGDTKSLSIAAASVIAKVTRDRMMQIWHEQFPPYHFANNKGYGTPEHLAQLQSHGPCPIHRRSFAPVAQTYLRFF